MGLAQYCRLDENGKQGSASSMRDRDGKSSFVSGAGNNFASFNVTVYGKLDAGSQEKDRMIVKVKAVGCNIPIETQYIYEWKPG